MISVDVHVTPKNLNDALEVNSTFRTFVVDFSSNLYTILLHAPEMLYSKSSLSVFNALLAVFC